jgi:hypothetical protein
MGGNSADGEIGDPSPLEDKEVPDHMRTLRIVMLAMGIAVLAMPAGAVAKNHGHGKLKGNAARLCKQLRTHLGADAFTAAYANNGSKHNAFGKCVKQTKKTLNGLRRSARQQCGTPQGTQARVSSDGQGDHSGRAFHTCVANDVGNDDESVGTAEAQCQAELAADPAAFDSQYGSDEQDANDQGADDQRNDDFAECVDQHAVADDDQGDQNDQGDDNQGSDQPSSGDATDGS